jgi:hypothetical protein
MKTYEETKCLYEVEKVFEWDKWRQEIPFLSFPADWLIKAIPPFSTGIIRYNIKHKDLPNSFVSVYLDCYDRAGCVGEPYWEVHPIDGDCERCLINETDELIAAITKSLDQQKQIEELRK